MMLTGMLTVAILSAIAAMPKNDVDNSSESCNDNWYGSEEANNVNNISFGDGDDENEEIEDRSGSHIILMSMKEIHHCLRYLFHSWN